jgi:hypothetical protein
MVLRPLVPCGLRWIFVPDFSRTNKVQFHPSTDNGIFVNPIFIFVML